MGVHQQVYETRMKYSDPDGYRDMMKAKVAHQNGDDNIVQTDTSIQGRGASGGVENLDVKHFEIDPEIQEAKERVKSYQTQHDYRNRYESNLNS